MVKDGGWRGEGRRSPLPADGALPPTPVGWRSASQVSREYVGGSVQIRKRMEAVRRSLIAEACDRGLSVGEAVALVEQDFVGLRKPWRGAASLAASPEAVRLMGLIPQRTPPRQAGKLAVGVAVAPKVPGGLLHRHQAHGRVAAGIGREHVRGWLVFGRSRNCGRTKPDWPEKATYEHRDSCIQPGSRSCRGEGGKARPI